MGLHSFVWLTKKTQKNSLFFSTLFPLERAQPTAELLEFSGRLFSEPCLRPSPEKIGIRLVASSE